MMTQNLVLFVTVYLISLHFYLHFILLSDAVHSYESVSQTQLTTSVDNRELFSSNLSGVSQYTLNAVRGPFLTHKLKKKILHKTESDAKTRKLFEAKKSIHRINKWNC